MIQPASPVIPGESWDETVIAADQPEYRPLPAIVCRDGAVVTRWRLGWGDRLRLLIRGDLYLQSLTFGQPF